MRDRNLLRGVSILVVEDHPASRRMVSALLQAAGADVTTVDSAEEALACLDTLTPKVAVIDVVLPNASGIALVKALKADEKTRAIVCIAVTVLNGSDTEESALAAGVVAYVQKPIDATFPLLVARHLGGTK